MMLEVTLKRLVSIPLLLLTTTFTTIAVDAFSSSIRHQKRSRLSYSCHSLRRVDLFGRRENKQVEFIEADDNHPNKSFGSSKLKGILKKDVKKLNWLSTPQSTRSYRNDIEKKNNKNKYKSKKKKKSAIRESISFRWRGFRQKIRQIVFRNTVYVLQCEDDKYYVGSTKNRKQRYRQHFEDARGGSKWTRLHKPIRVIAEYKRIPTRYLMGMESQKTAEYMMKYGVNNVRGAAFCNSREFTTADISDLQGFLGHYNQLDYQDLYKELRKVLPRPDSPTSSYRPPPRMYRKSNDKINDSDSNNPINVEEIPKAVIRRQLRNSTRKRRKKEKREAVRKKYDNPSDVDLDGQPDEL